MKNNIYDNVSAFGTYNDNFFDGIRILIRKTLLW